MDRLFRTDLPRGRGGLDLYKSDWMTRSSYMPGGNSNIGTGLGALGEGEDPNAPLDEPGMFDFEAKWNVIKNFIFDWDLIGYKMTLKIQNLAIIREKLMAQSGMDAIVNALNDDIAIVNLDIQNYWQGKSYIDQFWSIWDGMKSAMGLAGVRGIRGGQKGLGVLPAALIPVLTWGVLAAATWLATVGIICYQRYKSQTYTLDLLASPNLSPEARASLEAAQSELDNGGLLDNITASATSAFQIFLVAVLGYVGWQTFKMGRE